MIRRDRSTVGAPRSLTEAGQLGPRELSKARSYYAALPLKAYKFNAYKANDVREALETLFDRKCAYCESFYPATAPIDVEHYRPKGGVAEETTHGGYWWLAMAWENLLPSCIDCNRARGQVTVTEGMTNADVANARVANTGKAESFPIRGTRWKTEQPENNQEDALLLDPTGTRDPSQHLRFKTDAKVSMVIAAEGADGPDIYGATTIKVLGLNRTGLVQARTMALTAMQSDREMLLEFVANVANAETDGERNRWLAAAHKMFDRLDAMTKARAPYSALAAAFVADLKAELRRQAAS